MQVVEIIQASTEHVHPNPATQIHAQQEKVVFRLRKNNFSEKTHKQLFLKLLFRLRETPTLGSNGEPSRA